MINKYNSNLLERENKSNKESILCSYTCENSIKYQIYYGNGNMLLMDITTFKPEDSMEIFNRWEQMEKLGTPKGLKVVGQWFDAGGGRVITLFDVETVRDYAVYNFPFTDLCEVDVFPVIETDEFKEFASKCVENRSKMRGF
jgi:hypothetical protein